MGSLFFLFSLTMSLYHFFKATIVFLLFWLLVAFLKRLPIRKWKIEILGIAAELIQEEQNRCSLDLWRMVVWMEYSLQFSSNKIWESIPHVLIEIF